MLTGEVANRVREIVRQTCERFEIQILRSVVSKEYRSYLITPNPQQVLICNKEVGLF